MWQFWDSEMLQERLSNASATLQKRSTSDLHRLLIVFIQHGEFHAEQAGCCGALVPRVQA
jgi:hypothetical protein